MLTLESLLNDDRTLAVRADLELLMQSVNLENHIIGDLLDVTRIREGKLVLQRRITNMNEIIRQTARLLERDIVSKRITLKISTSAVESHAYIDTTRVQQILWVRMHADCNPHCGPSLILHDRISSVMRSSSHQRRERSPSSPATLRPLPTSHSTEASSSSQ